MWLHPDGRRLVLTLEIPEWRAALRVLDLESGTLSPLVPIKGGLMRCFMLEHATLPDTIWMVRTHADN